MEDEQSSRIILRYESSRYQKLKEDYSRIRTAKDRADWQDQAQLVASYMNETLSSVSQIIALEKARLKRGLDKNEEKNIKFSLMQYENFVGILQSQVEKLNKILEALAGSGNEVDGIGNLPPIEWLEGSPRGKLAWNPLSLALIIVIIFAIVVCIMIAIYPNFL